MLHFISFATLAHEEKMMEIMCRRLSIFNFDSVKNAVAHFLYYFPLRMYNSHLLEVRIEQLRSLLDSADLQGRDKLVEVFDAWENNDIESLRTIQERHVPRRLIELRGKVYLDLSSCIESVVSRLTLEEKIKCVDFVYKQYSAFMVREARNEDGDYAYEVIEYRFVRKAIKMFVKGLA
jgi:hypothetical protein